jgi:DNA-directed RNA polymerase specialized sigma24 family protein
MKWILPTGLGDNETLRTPCNLPVTTPLKKPLQSGSVREPEAMGGYVLGICRNLTLDRVRQRKRREELWSIYSPDLTPVELPLESAAPGEVLKLEVA